MTMTTKQRQARDRNAEKKASLGQKPTRIDRSGLRIVGFSTDRHADICIRLPRGIMQRDTLANRKELSEIIMRTWAKFSDSPENGSILCDLSINMISERMDHTRHLAKMLMPTRTLQEDFMRFLHNDLPQTPLADDHLWAHAGDTIVDDEGEWTVAIDGTRLHDNIVWYPVDVFATDIVVAREAVGVSQ